MREQVFDFAKQNVITKDNVNIEIDAMLYFQITDVHKAVYEIANLPDAIEKLCKTNLRNVAGKMDLDECLTSRAVINSELSRVMDEATDKWGVKVNRVELKDITPPHDIQQAMEKQMRAARDRRATILEAEGEKRSAILEAEGVRESQIKRAEGERQSAILRAEGEAEARIKVADAEKDAIALLAQSLAGTKADPAQYLIAVRYLESLKDMTSGKDNKVVYVPYEATGIIGSLGGIKDLLSGIGKPKSPPPKSSPPATRTSRKKSSLNSRRNSPAALWPIFPMPPRWRKPPTPLPATPRSRRFPSSTGSNKTRIGMKAGCSPMIQASKWMPSMARPACAAPAMPPPIHPRETPPTNKTTPSYCTHFPANANTIAPRASAA
jgi:regulator of protease activity HflC (stomatin/prohibitin superfamily)